MRNKDVQLPLRILARIQQHLGENNAIKIKALSEEFGICERQVKGHIEELRFAGYKIGSRKSPAELAGVFIATHPAEIFPTAIRMHEEGIKLLVCSKNLVDWRGVQPTLYEQLPETDESLLHLELTQ
jgi:hypothetical protein